MHSPSGMNLRVCATGGGAVAALLFGATLAQAQTSTWEPGTWIDNKTALFRFFVTAGAAACRDACMADGRCRAWQYTFPSFPAAEGRSRCALYSSASGKKAAATHVAGLVVAGVKRGVAAPPPAASPGRTSTFVPNRWWANYYAGGTVLGGPLNVTARACMLACVRDTRCKAWNFYTTTPGSTVQTGSCNFFTAVPSKSDPRASAALGVIRLAPSVPPPPAAATMSGLAAYNAGIAAYRRKDYAVVIEYMDRALQAGGLSPATRLLAMTARAESYAQLNRRPEARAAYDEILRLRPQDSVALTNRGAIHLFDGRYDVAIADFDAALRIAPRNAKALLGRGTARYFRREYDSAIADFDAALRIDPRNTYALGYRGRALAQKRDFARAEADFAALARIEPNSVDPPVGRGLIARLQDNPTAAIAAYDEALRRNPNNAEALRGRGASYVLVLNWDKALVDISALLRILPADISARKLRALIFRDGLKNLGMALADYNELIRLRADDPEAYSNRAIVHERKRDFAAALADWTKAIALAPRDATYRLRRAAVYHDGIKDYSHSVAELDEALRLDPKRALAYRNRAASYKMLGKLPEAIADMTKAIELEPKSIAYLRLRAHYYGEAGRYERALADHGTILELAPNDVEARLDRSYVYHNGLKDFGRAVEELNEAIRLDPRRGLTYRNRAASYSALGKLPEAIADMTKAIELEPKSVKWVRLRAEYYRKAGQYERALADLTAALKTKPDDEVSLALRGQVNRYLGQLDFALDDLNAAIRAKPDYGWAYGERSRVFLLRGDLERAEADAQSQARLEPGNSLAVFFRGRARYHLGRFAEAVTDLAAARERAPKDSWRVLWLHIAERRAGVAAAADNLARHSMALDLDKGLGPAVRLYLAKTTPEEVLAAAQDSDPVKQRERLSETNFYIAEHYLLAGDRAKAIAHFRAVLAAGLRHFVVYESARAELKALGASER